MKRKLRKPEKQVAPLDLESPINLALQVLGSRCELKRGAYFVDGVPRNVFELIDLANEGLERQGANPIKLRREYAGL